MPTRKPKAKKTPKKKKAVARVPVKTRKAVKVIDKVMKGSKGSAPSKESLFGELEELAKYIQNAKKEIFSLRPDEVKDDFLPTASDELDAIIEATADATNAIMDATEIIEETMSGLDGKAAASLMTATTNIYEACGFQDITGQRITKVVSTLKEIEEKIDGLLNAFGDGRPVKKKTITKKDKKVLSDEDLLNGPQSSDKATSQAEIDALLAGFD